MKCVVELKGADEVSIVEFVERAYPHSYAGESTPIELIVVITKCEGSNTPENLRSICFPWINVLSYRCTE